MVLVLLGPFYLIPENGIATMLLGTEALKEDGNSLLII